MPWKNIMEEENHLLKDDFFLSPHRYVHASTCTCAHTHTEEKEGTSKSNFSINNQDGEQ